MNSKLEMAKPSKLALVDWGWISAALIFLALMCFCILFFVKGANDLSATQTESLLRTPAPVAVTQAGPEPNPEVRAQPATAVTPPERQSRSSEAFGELAPETLSGGSATRHKEQYIDHAKATSGGEIRLPFDYIGLSI